MKLKISLSDCLRLFFGCSLNALALKCSKAPKAEDLVGNAISDYFLPATELLIRPENLK